MRACPPNRSCSRHHDGSPDTTGHARTTQAKSSGQPGNDRTPPDATSRENAAAGTPLGGNSGDAPPDVRGKCAERCATLADRDPDQAAHRTPHHEHQLPARRPSHHYQPRDSIENPDSHRQNAGVESGVTREHTANEREVPVRLTPRLHGPNSPYAYRRKNEGAEMFSRVARLVCLARRHRDPQRKRPIRVGRKRRAVESTVDRPLRVDPMKSVHSQEVQL